MGEEDHTLTVAPIRIAIFDRERTFAEALAARLALEADLEIVDVIQSVQSIMRVIATEHANVLLLDGDMPGNAALSLCTEISGRNDTPRVVVLSDSSVAERIVRAIRAGAAAWVNKGTSVEELLRVIYAVQRGETYLPPDTIGPVLRLLIDQDDDRHHTDAVIATLTPREREVLFHLANGRCRQDVAEMLHVSSNTVRTHLQNLMAKLGVHSSLEAVAWARSRVDRLSQVSEGGDDT
jgi:DNA-binding NarL/FixJ family response regulator